MTASVLKTNPQIVLPVKATLRDAMRAMTNSRIGLALVVDGRRRLRGVLADIDIRKALLAGADMGAQVARAMNPKPLTVRAGQSPEEIAEVFRLTSKSHLPVLDAAGRLVDLASFIDYAAIPKRWPNRVVVMAGGQGQRLRPLTAHTPKPMLKVGGKPILEHLLEQLAGAGFAHFTFTVNYLAEQIRAHFGDGSKWGVEISYVQETRPLGTVGALSLLKKPPREAILVLNGDVLTKVNFAALLDFHKSEKGLATLCVKRHDIQVPYGVVELADHRLSGFIEKPTHRFLVNAGIYVIDPKALAWLPKGRPCDMPDFLKKIRRRRSNGVACFPIEEYWLDIGGMPEFLRAEDEFKEIFRP